MIEEHLTLPFATEILGVKLVVERVELTVDGRIVAVCSRAGYRQRVSILDLALPDPAPSRVEWIEAYRRWAGGTQR